MPKCQHIVIALSLLLAAAVESPAQILEAVELIDDQPPLSTVTSIEISPDGNHLYAVSPAAQLVSAYARNAQTGTLTLVNSEPYPTTGIGMGSGLFGSQAALIQGASFLLVGSLFENGSDLASYQRDELSGALTPLDNALLSLSADQRMLSFAVSPAGDFLYVLVLNIIDPKSTTERTIDLRSYAIDDSAAISLMDTRTIQDTGPAEVGETLLISPDGQDLYVSGRRGLFTSDNRPGLHFSRNAATGALTLLGTLDALSQTGQLAAAAFSMDGSELFYQVTVPSDPPFSQIGLLQRESGTGILNAGATSPAEFINRLDIDDTLALAANGRLLASTDRLGLFLTPSPGGDFLNLETQISNGLTADTRTRAVAFSPDEAFLYVALDGTVSADDGMLILSNRGLLEPPAVPTLSAPASLLLMALLLLTAAAYYQANRSSRRARLEIGSQ